MLSSTAGFCEGRLAPNSIYAVLHRECRAMFPDELFADLFAEDGRRSVPPMIVAVVMVLQRLEGLSDREAVERFAFDVPLEVRGRRAGLRPPGVRAHRPGGHAGEAGRFRPAEPDLRADGGGGRPGGAGRPPPGAGLGSDL
ncbi:hypothetical protein [Kitasatospora sp. NPDC017646]|uniref:hypothetical protein n=1 Tax=Kitasatospora sp. NPDC017646 TaxID=3364024 RepID=UPI003788E89E